MKLISVHISNFGKLNNYDFSFETGFSAIIKENGWGKSTLAAFLCAMFYGLEDNKKDKFCERKKCIPFGYDSASGYIIFEENNKSYRLMRTFRNKLKDDSFALFDELTNLPCNDFSQNIGEELFHVDKDSFRKTLFFMQGDIEIGATTGIMSGMGAGELNINDIDELEGAIKLLQEKRNIYDGKSKGLIKLERDRIKNLRAHVKLKDSINLAIEDTKQYIAEAEDNKAAMEKAREEISAQIAVQSKRDTALGEYRTKISDADVLLAKLNEKRRLLGSNPVSVAEIMAIFEKYNKCNELESKIKMAQAKMPEQNTLNYLDNLFGRIPEAEEIHGFYEKLKLLKEARAQLVRTAERPEDMAEYENLQMFFAEHEPSEDEVRNQFSLLDEIEENRQKLDEKKDRLRVLELKIDEQEKKKLPVPLPVSALVIEAVGTVVCLVVILASLFANKEQTLLITGGATGFACLLFFLIFGLIKRGKALAERKDETEKRNKLAEACEAVKTEVSTMESSLEEAIDKVNRFISFYPLSRLSNQSAALAEVNTKLNSYKRLSALFEKREEQRRQLNETINEIEEQFKQKFAAYLLPGNYIYGESDSEIRFLENLDASLKEYKEVCKIRELEANITPEMDELEAEIASFLKPFVERGCGGDTAEECLRLIKETTIAYNNELDSINLLNKRILELESEFDFNEITKSVNELDAERDNIAKDIKNIESDIEEYTKTLDKNMSELASIENDEEEIEIALSHIMGYEEKVEDINIAIEFMNTARDNFISRYIGPLRDRLGDNLKFIAGENAPELIVDANLSLSYETVENGKDIEYLSTGLKDLVYICARFALADLIFGDHIPFMVLDDPFCNLDSEKMNKALYTIQKFSEKCQVIYLTCHESRMTNT